VRGVDPEAQLHPPHPFEDALLEHTAPGEDVAQHAQGGELHPMQKAFHEKHALQCGFCTPGMIMQSIDLIKEHPDPDEHTVRDGLEGNLCRCTGYQNIVAAVQEAARTTRESAVSTTEEGAA